jgi:hypothetical protein
MNTRQAGKKEVKKHESRDKGVKVSRAKHKDYKNRFQETKVCRHTKLTTIDTRGYVKKRSRKIFRREDKGFRNKKMKAEI